MNSTPVAAETTRLASLEHTGLEHTGATVRLLTSPRWWQVTLVVIIVLEAVVLHSSAHDNVVPFYALNLDQVQYLGEGYTGYQTIVRDGVTGVLELIFQPHGQGMLLQVESALLFLLTGHPGRTAALDLNLAYFLVYLAVTAIVLKRSFSAAAALLSMALIASAATTFISPGGLFDFRLDFAAMCLWGILLALAVMSPPRRTANPRLLALVCLVSSCLVLTRIIAVVYVAMLLGMLLVFALFARLRSRSPRLPLQLGELVVALAWSLLVAGAYVVRNWSTLSEYYIFGHVTGDEKHVRALEVGVTDLTSSLEFYGRSLLNLHAGATFVQLAGVVLVASLVVVIAFWSFAVIALLLWSLPVVTAAETPSETPAGRGLWIMVGLVTAIVGPYIVLTLDESKSGVVGDVLLPPLVLVIVSVFAFLTGAAARGSKHLRFVVLALSVGALLAGLTSGVRQLRQTVYLTHQADLATASRMMRDVGDYVMTNQGGTATWAVDEHLDFLAPGSIALYYFEQNRVWLGITGDLGVGPVQQELPPDQILQKAEASDVLVLTRGGQGPNPYPNDVSIGRVKDELFALAGQPPFALLGEYRVFDRDVYVFVRPRASG